MAEKVVTQAIINALIEQNAHLVEGEQGLPRLFQRLQRRVTADAWKTFKEPVQTVASLDVFEQCTHEYPRTPENRFTRHDGGIANDYGLHTFKCAIGTIQ